MPYKIIISFILLIIFILYKIIINKKYNKKNTTISKKEQKIVITLIIISIILFLTVLIIQIINNGKNPGTITTINYLTNAFTIALIIFPLNLISLYKRIFTCKEKLLIIKTVVTNTYNEEIVNNLNKAHINTIVFTKDKLKNIDTILEEEIKRKHIHKTICIQSDNIHILDKWLNKSTTIYETKDLNKLYQDIINSRCEYDKYIRIIKYIIMTYLTIFLSCFITKISGFPYYCDLLLVVLLKIGVEIAIYGLYNKLPIDSTVAYRHSKEQNTFMSKQEIIFTIAQCFINVFFINVPFMYVLAEATNMQLAFSLYLHVFIYTNIFNTYSSINDSFIVKIIIKNIKNIRLYIYTIVLVLFTLLLNFINIFNTCNIGFQNYYVCMLFGFSTIFLNELVKIARYTSAKRRNKYELKNN